jgi:PDZ domain-containing protein
VTDAMGPAPVEPTVNDADPVGRPGRRVRRSLVATTAVALGVAGVVAWNHPVGFDAEVPGPILDLGARVHADGASTTPINGAFDGLTVVIRPMTLGDRVLHAITGDPTRIVPDSQVYPPDVPSSTYHALEKSAYVDGGQVAAAVAERALGKDVAVTSDGLTIQGVADASPASKVLSTGDVITAVDGQRAQSTTQLSDAVQASAGRPVTLTVVPSGVHTTRTVSVTPTESGADHRLVIGVMVEANVKVDLAVPVTVDASGVEGPSAGLMTALTVYDQLSPIDLAAGRKIAGTGTLDVNGTVGEIGGIEAKARAAAAAGAELFIAPATQAADARAVLAGRVPVIGVDTFQQALDALRATRAPSHLS